MREATETRERARTEEEAAAKLHAAREAARVKAEAEAEAEAEAKRAAKAAADVAASEAVEAAVSAASEVVTAKAARRQQQFGATADKNGGETPWGWLQEQTTKFFGFLHTSAWQPVESLVSPDRSTTPKLGSSPTASPPSVAPIAPFSPPLPPPFKCFLLWSETNGGSFITQWSDGEPHGALASYEPPTAPAAWRYLRNDGRSELTRGVGGPNGRKQFYGGWCSFLKAAWAGALTPPSLALTPPPQLTTPPLTTRPAPCRQSVSGLLPCVSPARVCPKLSATAHRACSIHAPLPSAATPRSHRAGRRPDPRPLHPPSGLCARLTASLTLVASLHRSVARGDGDGRLRHNSSV